MVYLTVTQKGQTRLKFWQLLLLKAIRQDRLITGATAFCVVVFGESFVNGAEHYDFAKVIEVLLVLRTLMTILDTE